MRHIVTLTNRSRILYKKETCFFPEGSHKFPNTYDQDINIATMSKYTPIKNVSVHMVCSFAAAFPFNMHSTLSCLLQLCALQIENILLWLSCSSQFCVKH